MKAKSISGKSIQEIRNQLESCMRNNFKPTLAFAFVTLNIEWQKVRDLLVEKDIAVFGAKTAIPFDDKSLIHEGIVIMLLDINPKSFKIVISDIAQNSLSESVNQICNIGKNSFSRPAFLISVADVSNSGDEIMKKFVQEIGNGITITGAYSGDFETWNGNIFTNVSSSNNGLMALILDEDKIDVKGTAVSGWQAVGTEKTVTKSEGIWLHTIDDQPAIDVVKKFVGDTSIENDNSDKIIKLDTTTYVLQAKRDGDSPSFYATLEYNSENGAIKCSAPIAEGTKFRFSLPPDFEVVDEVIGTSVRTKEKELPEADVLIIFTCIGRIITLGPMAEDEIKGLASTWETPTAGFFSLGEFGRVQGGRPEYHATTCSWVALKEK